MFGEISKTENVFFLYFFPTTLMVRVSFSPAPECVVADCWNRAFPTPPCHQATVVVVMLYLDKLLGGKRVFWKAIYTTLKYFGLAGWLAREIEQFHLRNRTAPFTK